MPTIYTSPTHGNFIDLLVHPPPPWIYIYNHIEIKKIYKKGKDFNHQGEK